MSIYVLRRNMKNIRIFLSDNFHFFVVKFSVYLNRHVFIMWVLNDTTTTNILSKTLFQN